MGQRNASDITRTTGSLAGSRSWDRGADMDLAFEETVDGHEGGAFAPEKVASCGDEGAADGEREDGEMHGVCVYNGWLGIATGLVDALNNRGDGTQSGTTGRNQVTAVVVDARERVEAGEMLSMGLDINLYIQWQGQAPRP